jgi:sugar O-acyltransferase (sialic acid O-acetyltransferase NeuD family)
MNKHNGLLIIGAGGHGRVVADIAKRTGCYQEIAFLDDAVLDGTFAYPYFGKTDAAFKYVDRYDMVVAIGNGAVRKRIMDALESQGAYFATVISPDAVIAEDVVIGGGTVIGPSVVINTGTVIGKGVILNTASSVDHDCVIGDFCHVAVGARVCGTVAVGEHTWIGAGATVINNITVCPECLIGAGAVVVKNISSSGTYLGVPAKANG